MTQAEGKDRTSVSLRCILAMPKGVFVVLHMTSPDQSCHIILCSSYLSVNSAPGGPDYALCLPLNCLFALSTTSQSIYSCNW